MPSAEAAGAKVETGAQNGQVLGEWITPNGLVRVKYRTALTAADAFSRSFLVSRLDADGNHATLNAEDMARWCLNTFVVTVETRNGESDPWGEARPWSWGVLEALTGPHAADGWPAILAMHLWQNVVSVDAENLEALKKTSLTSSGPGSSDAPPPAPPSHTST